MLSSRKCISIIFMRDKYYYFACILSLFFIYYFNIIYFGINLFRVEENEIKYLSTREVNYQIRIM